MIPLDRVRELLSLAPGPHGGTLMDTSMVHDLARDVLSLADALATAERERDAALASADLSARAAVDAARELGHVAAAAIARADAADARSANLLMCGEAAERAATEAHAQHAALAAAVRAYLDADRDWRRSRYMIAEHINAAAVENTERLSVERYAAWAALDALLRGAPCGYVPVPVVQRCLDAVDEWERERSAPVARTVARAAMVAARTALDAALAAATTTPKESP